jgi:hypothetical protein
MGKLVLSLVLIGVAAEALAQSRPNTERMSCGQAQSLVATQGAVVLYSGPYTYDHFVRGRPAADRAASGMCSGSGSTAVIDILEA